MLVSCAVKTFWYVGLAVISAQATKSATEELTGRRSETKEPDPSKVDNISVLTPRVPERAELPSKSARMEILVKTAPK